MAGAGWWRLPAALIAIWTIEPQPGDLAILHHRRVLVVGALNSRQPRSSASILRQAKVSMVEAHEHEAWECRLPTRVRGRLAQRHQHLVVCRQRLHDRPELAPPNGVSRQYQRRPAAGATGCTADNSRALRPEPSRKPPLLSRGPPALARRPPCLKNLAADFRGHLASATALGVTSTLSDGRDAIRARTRVASGNWGLYLATSVQQRDATTNPFLSLDKYIVVGVVELLRGFSLKESKSTWRRSIPLEMATQPATTQHDARYQGTCRTTTAQQRV